MRLDGCIVLRQNLIVHPLPFPTNSGFGGVNTARSFWEMERANYLCSILVFADFYGMYMPAGLSWQNTVPAASATGEILALIGPAG